MSFSKNQISVCFILSLFNGINQLKIMPEKRKRNAGLSNRKKYNQPGRSFIRSYENVSTMYLPSAINNIENINQNNNLGNDVHCSDDCSYCSIDEPNRDKNSHSLTPLKIVTILFSIRFINTTIATIITTMFIIT